MIETEYTPSESTETPSPMADALVATETQAHDLLRQRDWQSAIQLYDQLLSSPTIQSTTEQTIAHLIGRTECQLELKLYDNLVVDCRRLLLLLLETDASSTVSRVRRRLIHGLYRLKRYTEAETACCDWSQSMVGQATTTEMVKWLDRYRTVIQIANGQKSNQRISLHRLDKEMGVLDAKLEIWAANHSDPDRFHRFLSETTLEQSAEAAESTMDQDKLDTDESSLLTTDKSPVNNGEVVLASNDVSSSAITCTYCSISFNDRMELRAHCQTEQHQNVIMSDEGRDWKWRPPPRGYSADSYNLCESFTDNGLCHYSNQCAEAHGLEELSEWKERLEYRKMRVKRACEKELYGKSYTEQLLEKWVNAPSPDRIMNERVEGVEETVSNDLVTTVSSKTSTRDWTFTVKTKRSLHAVALLQDAHRNHFVISQVIPDNATVESATPAELTSDQEWVSATPTSVTQTEEDTAETRLLEHQVKVVFSTDIYGTFRQTVVFDFGQQPVLIKQICVDVIPVSDADKIQEIRNEMVLSTAERWNSDNAKICLYTTPFVPHLTTPAYLADELREKELLERYPCPKASTFTLTQPTITEKRLTKNNYRSRIHELLYVEEIARYEQVAKYNLRTKLRVTNNYVLTPSGMATSTAKYSHSGELFALLTLGKDVSEDTSAGRLILNNCTSVYIAKAQTDKSTKTTNRKVYEAMIEDKGKTMIYLKLSAQGVKDLGMTSETDFDADIQFQLNRLSYCEWHHALDKIADFRIIFPETYIEPSIEWSPRKHWDDSLDQMLNSKQKEAVLAITTPSNVPLPPILLIGPFGTGKTFTLASSIKQVLLQPETRILICTHSNSAADLYIKDYLHPWVEEGMEEAKPLRVYYHKRWVATVNTTVQKYCLIDLNINVRNFRRPSREDIMKYRIVVVTLSISMELASLGLPKGYFTHIFLDEAAQAMECEAIMPLALAGDTTRIVLAGDHMQMSPELFSNFAKERKLHISLLERLYDHYPADFPCKILLCENYRAHEAITKFTSELFYDQKLIASGKQPRHERYYPLTFFTTRGEDVQDKNSTAFYNNSEVYEVVERVSELRKKWPTTWGKLNEQSIGIMTPYADQVFRIRAELRKRRMGGISVERVLNVQGKQFRAVFLSTVRTRRTCTGSESGGKSESMDYGFLSNSKLLNTAITRAQSLVAVVGDPVALCSIGRCRKVWERFIEICNLNQSLFGITWSTLRSQLDGVELKKTYVLNPLAPEFVPRALQAESYLRDQQVAVQHSTSQHPAPHQLPHQPPPPQLAPHPTHQHPMTHGHPSHGGHHHGQHPAMPPPTHHMNHGNFPPHQSLIQPPMRGGPPMPHYGGPPGPPSQPIHPNAPQQQYPPFVFYPNQPQSSVGGSGGSGGGGPHGPPSQQQVAPIIRPPPHMQPPQPQSNFLPSTQQNLWGPSQQFPNAQNPWPKLGTGPHMNRPQTLPMTQGPPLNMPPSVRQQQQQHQQQQLRSPVSQQQQHQQQHMSHPSQHQQLGYLQGGNKPSPTGQQQQQQMHGQHQQPSQPFMQMSSVQQQQQQQQNAMRMGPGPVSPANLMHPAQDQQHMSPLTSEVMASIAARVNQVAHVYQAAKQRGNNGQSVVDHLMDKELQFMQQGLSGGVGGLPHQGLQSMAGGGGGSTMPLNMIGDYSFLLPPNMTFYEMALEPKDFQFKWFVKIVDSHGIEMANKFTEILRQMPNSLSNISSGHSSTKIHRNDLNVAHNYGPAGDMGFDILSTTILNELMLKEQQQQQHQMHQQQHQVQQQHQHHNQLQQQQQHHHPPPGLHHQQQQQQTHAPQLHSNHQPQVSNSHHLSNTGSRHTSDMSLSQRISSPPSLAAASTSAMQSVPLYRRQAGLSLSSGGSSGMGPDLLNDPHIFDNLLFSQNDGSFQGLPPIQTLAAGIQHQQQQQIQLQQSNSYASGLHANPQTALLLQQQLQQQQQQQQQHQQMQVHRGNTNGAVSGNSRMGSGGLGGGDDLLAGRQTSASGTTYASVLSQGGGSNKPPASPDDKDPFAAIRELGQRSNGLYNYFQ